MKKLQLIFLCIFNFMLVFCEKWNIIWLETANKSASWCREPMIRGVVVKGYCSVQEIANRILQISDSDIHAEYSKKAQKQYLKISIIHFLLNQIKTVLKNFVYRINSFHQENIYTIVKIIFIITPYGRLY